MTPRQWSCRPTRRGRWTVGRSADMAESCGSKRAASSASRSSSGVTYIRLIGADNNTTHHPRPDWWTRRHAASRQVDTATRVVLIGGRSAVRRPDWKTRVNAVRIGPTA
eukprot:646346-Pyramimonas_sp.AAC.1